jgi:glycosyltransferase involved in cell wall biosynthesis/tRNA isopentenyl-2-thiomethyl-A-37 hydroxylase MiaE
MLLSIAMIVKNEEKHLEKCLTALLPLQKKIESEIVIVDTGSTDNTVSIAKKFTKKVFSHEWNGNFADMRNISIQKCMGEWIFVVDADEVLEDGTDIINFFISGAYKSFKSAAIGIKTRNEINKEEDFNKYVVANLVRLFKRKDNIYIGRVHEQPLVESPCYKLKSYLLHYGYVTTDANLMKYKFERNTKLLFEDLKQNPNHIYTLYQLSNSYSMYGDYKQALNYIKKAYSRIISKSDISKNIYVIHQYARMCYTNGLHENVIEACQRAIAVKKDFIDFYYYLGRSQMLISKNEEAIESYKKYLCLQSEFDNLDSSNDLSMVTYTLCLRNEVLSNISYLCSKVGEYITALEYIKQIKEDSFIESSLENYVYCLIRTSSMESIYDLYIKEKNNDFRSIIVNSVDKFMIFLSSDEQEKIIRLFSKEDSDYGLVCKLKINSETNILDIKKLKDEINTFQFEHYAEYKSHLFYYIIKDDMDNIYSFLSLDNNILKLYLRDILKNCPESALKLFNYIRSKVFESDINKIYTNMAIVFTLMISNKFSDKDYTFLFKKYIYDTMQFMKYMYKKDMLNINNHLLFINKEELFCLYIDTAVKKLRNNKLEYIKTLRKALKLCNHHKKGIELLIDGFIEQPTDEEFGKLSKDLKRQIQQLINNEEFSNARILLNEYKKINSSDEELLSIEAVMDFYKGDNLEASVKFLESLFLSEDNYETLFNIGYLLEVDNNYNDSYYFYQEALTYCYEEEMKAIIQDKIENIGKLCK